MSTNDYDCFGSKKVINTLKYNNYFNSKKTINKKYYKKFYYTLIKDYQSFRLPFLFSLGFLFSPIAPCASHESPTYSYQDKSSPIQTGMDSFFSEHFASHSEDSDDSNDSQYSDYSDDSESYDESVPTPSEKEQAPFQGSSSDPKTITAKKNTPSQKFQEPINISSSDDDYQGEGERLIEIIKKQQNLEKSISIAAKDPALPDGLLSYIQTQRDVKKLFLKITSDKQISNTNKYIEKDLSVHNANLRALFGDPKTPRQPTINSNLDEYLKIQSEQKKICDLENLKFTIYDTVLKVMGDLETLRVDKHGMDYYYKELLRLASEYCSPVNVHEEFYQYFYHKLSAIESPIFSDTLLSFDRLENRQGVRFKTRADLGEIQEICEKSPYSYELKVPSSYEEPYQILNKDKSIMNTFNMNANSRKSDPVEIWDLKNKIFIEYGKIIFDYLEMNKGRIVKNFGDSSMTKSYKILHDALLTYYTISCVFIMDSYANRSILSHAKKKTGKEPETQKFFATFKKSYKDCFRNYLEKDIDLAKEISALNTTVEENFEKIDILFNKQMSIENISSVVTSGVTTAVSAVANGGVNLSIAANVLYSIGSSYWGSSNTTPTTTTSKPSTNKWW